MKKFLSATLTALLLSGSISALAAVNTYTDADSGFKIKTQPSWMEIGGANFYGLANKPDKKETSLNIICAFTAKEVEEATGKKFSTEEFTAKFKDLQVLERNGLSPEKVNYLLFMPDPYEIKENNKLSLMPKDLLDNSTISISTSKKNKTPYVYLHVVDDRTGESLKNSRRPVDMQVALTSQNDMLYAVVSMFPLPDLSAQKEMIEEATPFTKKKVRSKLTGGNKEKINSYIASRQAFIKNISYFTPVKETEPYGFYDALLGGKITLPKDWAYVQVNDDTVNEKIPVKITFATPWSGVSEIFQIRANTDSKDINGKDATGKNTEDKHADGKVVNNEEADKTKTDSKDKFSLKGDAVRLNFQKINEAVIFASSQPKEKKSFVQLFDNPILTQLIIDKLINKGIEHPSVKEFIAFNELKTSSDFNSTYGTILLTGNGSIKNKYSFNVNANLMVTPDNFGMTSYFSRENHKINPELERILSKVKLVTKK